MSKKRNSRAFRFESNYPPEYLFPGYSTYNPYQNTGGFAVWGIRWIYALLLLIVIVLQFGTNQQYKSPGHCTCPCSTCESFGCCRGGYTAEPSRDNQLIDNSVLFIIVVFLLVMCAGCWWGGYGGYGGTAGY